MRAKQLKALITEALVEQGFRVQRDQIIPPANLDKDTLRRLHALAVEHRVERSKSRLRRRECRLVTCLASGTEIVPEQIVPQLVEVAPGSEDEILFRYISLHWSIPVSSGYGRRLRFLVVDQQNEKLIGIFGLGDPVFSLADRDKWIGWDKQARKERLHHVMDAFVLGAVPPYSHLLCGKLVAMLAASNEVRDAFKRKYGQRKSIVRGRRLDGRLALITTTSALGRSSVYNRITFGPRLLYHKVGFTQGSGEFQFSNGVYNAIFEYAAKHCKPTAKQDRWGRGFRNRREVVKKCLATLGLPTDWLYHGIRREIMVVPLAENAREFVAGDQDDIRWFHQPAEDLFAWFRERWLLPRAERDRRYLEFRTDAYRLWTDRGVRISGDEASALP